MQSTDHRCFSFKSVFRHPGVGRYACQSCASSIWDLEPQRCRFSSDPRFWRGWNALLAPFPVVNLGYIQIECKRLIVLRSVRGKGDIASFSLIRISFTLWNLKKGILSHLPETHSSSGNGVKPKKLRKGPGGINNSFGSKKLLVPWVFCVWEVTNIFGFLRCQLASVHDTPKGDCLPPIGVLKHNNL